MQSTDRIFDLEIFILQSGSKFANEERLRDSLPSVGLPVRVTSVHAGTSTHQLETNCSWFAIFFDDEMIDPELAQALPTFIKVNIFDALCLWKKSGLNDDFKFSKTPRVFRNGVRLEMNSFVPKNVASLRFTNVLDGWILDQATVQITGEGVTSV